MLFGFTKQIDVISIHPIMAPAHNDSLSPEHLRTLQLNRWFNGLSPEQQKTLTHSGHLIRLSSGRSFSSQGQMPRSHRDGFAVLLQGALKVSSTSLAGREAILGYVWPGQWFGELSILDGYTRERDFISVDNSQLWVIEPQTMDTLLQDAAMAKQLTQLLASRARHLYGLVEDFSLRSSLSRTARRLVMLAYDDGPQTGMHRSQLPVSQDALASMLGLTRQSVGSQLRRLSECGAIAQSYGGVRIASMVALLAEAAT